jgi:type III secretion system inner membrane ring protein
MLRKLPLLFILVLIALGATACNSNRELVGGLTELEAHRICVVLQRNGLIANKVKTTADDQVTWTVTVEAPLIIGDDEVASALYILRENDLPRSRENPYKMAFPKESLIPTQTEESLRKLAATQESIEHTLETVAGVVSCKVLVVLPKPDPLVEATRQIQASASVLLKYNTPTEPLTVDEVRSLVAPAVEGLSPERVNIVMKPVPAPDINKFKDMKNRFIKIIGLAAISLVLILTGLLIFFIMRTRGQGERIAQLERSLALRPVTKKDQPAPPEKAAVR